MDLSWYVTEASSNNSDNEAAALATTLAAILPLVNEATAAVAADIFNVSDVTDVSCSAGAANFSLVTSRCLKTDDIMKRKVADIVESYRAAMAQPGSASHDDLVALFQRLEAFPGTATLQFSTVMPIVRKMTEEFRNFAQQQR